MTVPSPSKVPLFRWIGALLGCLVGQQVAFAQEYRQIEWADGRVWTAEVMETTAEGMRLRMAQGEAVVPYAEIQAIVPLDEAGFLDAPRWTVELLPLEAGGDEANRSEAREVFEILRKHLEEMSGIESRTGRKVTRGAPLPVVEDCGIPSTVSVEERARDGVDHVLVGHFHQGENAGQLLTLCGLSTAGSRPLRRLEVRADAGLEAAQILGALYRILGLEPDDAYLAPLANEVGSLVPVQEIPAEAQPAAPQPAEALPAEALAFVPLPGFPSLVARDMRRFGWAWAVVVPATVLAGLWVAEAGFAPGHVLFLTGAAYYTLTVGANLYFGQQTAAQDP